MHKLLISLFLFLLVIAGVKAQKIMEKQYDANGIENLIIDGNGVYEIHVITENRRTISLKATIAGETSNDVMVTEKTHQKSLNFGVNYAPYFVGENDKLAAHKVLSVILEYRIPEGMKVEIFSDIGSVWGSGRYGDFNISLEQGSCYINDFYGNATIMTLTGAIEVSVLGNVSGSGISKYGNVSNNLNRGNTRYISAESRDGNITLTQTEN